MTPEQRIIDALYDSDRSHMSGVTVGENLIECDSCGEQFPYWARWLDHREQARATATLDAVRAALASDDPAVMRAMAGRVGLRVDTDRAIPLPCGHFAGAKIKRIRVSGPWREVPE